MINELKTSFVQTITEATKLPVAKIGDESKVRVVIENAAGGNVVTISARIIGQADWDLLATISATSKTVVNVSTYDEMLVECVSFATTGTTVKVILSSFNDAGGSTTIDAPTGGSISGDNVNFTSSDSSVIITADPSTNTIDFQAVGGGGSTPKYVVTVSLADWVGPSAGEYSLSIPFAFHSKANPVVTCYETNGGDFDLIDTSIQITNNDVKVFTLATPDTRFIGKIFID